MHVHNTDRALPCMRRPWTHSQVGDVHFVYITWTLRYSHLGGVTFLCCNGYACAACDVRMIQEAREIKRHVWWLQETPFQRTRKRFGKQETELMSSPFSNCRGIDFLCLYSKESRILNTANVVTQSWSITINLQLHIQLALCKSLLQEKEQRIRRSKIGPHCLHRTCPYVRCPYKSLADGNNFTLYLIICL